MIDVKVLGKNIRRERQRQLLTIEQLAEKAGLSDNFLGKIERGEERLGKAQSFLFRGQKNPC